MQIDLDSLDKNSRKILEYYIQESRVSLPKRIEVVETEIYERPSQATVDYESSLTLDEILARDKEQKRLEEKKRKKEEKRKRKRQLDILEQDDTEAIINNEILRNRNIK